MITDQSGLRPGNALCLTESSREYWTDAVSVNLTAKETSSAVKDMGTGRTMMKSMVVLCSPPKKNMIKLLQPVPKDLCVKPSLMNKKAVNLGNLLAPRIPAMNKIQQNNLVYKVY